MRDKEIREGLADLAQRAEMDHEVQMARSDLYKIAKYAIKLHEMLKTVSEAQGLEGWQQSKITKAADYMGSVYHAMDYDMQFGEQTNEEAEPTNYKSVLEKRLGEKKKKSGKKSPAGGPPCWDGKKIHPTKPTKMKGGKRVNNCIDADSSDGK